MKWWHTIELPNGEVTDGRVDYRGERGKRFFLPEDLSGKSVLDFGTWDGYWAIEAKRRGAREVVATDRFLPAPETTTIALSSFGIPYFYSGNLDFPLEPWTKCFGEIEEPFDFKNRFDVVLFYGILYHLKNPYMGLLNAYNCCKKGGMVIVESAANQGKIRGLSDDVPLLWVVDVVHDKDRTNYYVPNALGVLQLCKLANLEPEEHTPMADIARFTVVCRRKDE
jgi:tRNA (mo5U34)-methyltransferase